MAERRMFAKSIVTSDDFLDMPTSARCLYFTLGMFADDDGFVNSPRSIMRQVGATTDDMNILLAKRYVIAFDSGVIVIRHWRIHNYIQSDRYHETMCKAEKKQLTFSEDGKVYEKPLGISTMDTECIQDVSEMDTEVRLGKDRLGKDRLGKDRLGKDKTIVSKSPRLSELKKEFEVLWGIYPKKQGKDKAFGYYEKARKSGATYEEVGRGIAAYREYIEANSIDMQYVKMGSTFFSQKSWSDDWTIRNGKRDESRRDFFAKLMEEHKDDI